MKCVNIYDYYYIWWFNVTFPFDVPSSSSSYPQFPSSSVFNMNVSLCTFFTTKKKKCYWHFVFKQNQLQCCTWVWQMCTHLTFTCFLPQKETFSFVSLSCLAYVYTMGRTVGWDWVFFVQKNLLMIRCESISSWNLSEKLRKQKRGNDT